MNITIKKNPNPSIFKEFELVEPNVVDWIEATKNGASLKLSGEGFLILDHGTLLVLRNLVVKNGLFDGEKKSLPWIQNLPLMFYVSFLGKLMSEDSFLMDSELTKENKDLQELEV